MQDFVDFDDQRNDGEALHSLNNNSLSRTTSARFVLFCCFSRLYGKGSL